MEFNEVNCPVCEKNDYKVVYPGTLGKNAPVFGYKWTPEIRKIYRLVQCKNCSHAYASPRLSDIYKYYEDVKDETYLNNAGLRKKTARKVLTTIKKFKPDGKLLDVGCSTGDFLEVAKEDYESEGMELSEWALKIAREKQLLVYKETLRDRAAACRASYDVVTMWGVIEHLEYPKLEIQRINSLLKEGGIVALWTGDFNSIFSKIFRQKWWYILGQHIQFFSWKSMDYLMEEAGFQRVHKGIYPYVISFEYLGVSLSRYSIVGPLVRNFFKLYGLAAQEFTLKKSDEMFAIYKKVRNN
ncbi:MAG: hypothetical protein A3F16_00755 [Deltaproteobacteria bacterium RIFCSPHIGHO2_12_FULL_43_9]|nr:MAG: hypothetical protein A3F16_00755 [Deltaproteobacteria bacterium RIFCSPHIGHO2_12_FULL_43_9]